MLGRQGFYAEGGVCRGAERQKGRRVEGHKGRGA